MLARVCLLGLFTAGSAIAGPSAKVDVCHQDDQGLFQVININGNAVKAHLTNHGDAYPATWWPDSDGDGYGDPDAATDPCPQMGLVDNGDDCDASDPAINPGATEVPYDGVDNDCAASTLDDDLDQDGFLLADDCNDQNAEVNPAAAETPYDGTDNDCEPATPDDDLDGDGFLIADDCNDENAAINPSVTEVCGDSMDNNCDSEIDEGCVANECPCFTSELILEQYDRYNADAWQSTSSGCRIVDSSSYYYYDYDYTQIYFYGYRYDGTSYEAEHDYFYSLDYDDYYDATYCHGNSYNYGYDYSTGQYNYSNDFYSFQYLTPEQHASCEALLVDTAAMMGMSCQTYSY